MFTGVVKRPVRTALFVIVFPPYALPSIGAGIVTVDGISLMYSPFSIPSTGHEIPRSDSLVA